MSQTTETILLQIDVAANTTRLVELRKELLANQESLAKYNKAAKEGRISLDELAVAEQRLKADSANLNQEIRTLTKANEAQVRVSEAGAGSIEQLRAQLALGTAEYNKLSAAERDNTEVGQKLQANNKALSDNLKILEGDIGDTRRNVGNYGAAIDPLIAQLVKLEEAQKLAAPDSQEYARNVPIIKGFQQQINDGAIKAGLSQEALNDKYTQTADAIRPATAALVKLEAEQAKAEKGSDAYTAIGFKIGQASKAIEHATAEIKKAPPETKKLSSGLLDAARNSDLFGGAVDKASGVQEKFAKAQELAKLATGGWTGALGLLRVAIIATGLGALAIVLGSVVTYLTQTAEGSRLLTTVLDQVGAVVNVVKDRFGAFGKAVTQILSGDFKGAAATAKGAMSGFGDEIKREVKLTGDLSRARQQLDIDTAKNISTNKRLLNEVERLKNVRDNEFNTVQQRQRANEEAYRIELTREKTLSDLASRRIAILKGEIDLRGGLSKASLEQRKELGEAENELADIQEDAAGKQNELITNRFTLNKEKLEQQAKLETAAIQQVIAGIQTELAAVKEGSARELQLRQDLIIQQGKLDAVGAEKTAAERKLIISKNLQDILKLDEEFDKSRQERARKFLDDQDKANATALSYQQNRKAAETKDQEDAYARDERLLQRNLDRRTATLEKDYAEGRVSKEHYEQSLQILEESGLSARIVLQKQFNKDSAQLETQLAKVQGAARRNALDKDQQLNASRLEAAQDFGAQVGQAFASTLNETGVSLQEFAGKVLVLILDQIEKVVIAQQASATAQSLAQPDSVATAGVTGLARAAILNGLIIAAFEGAKAIITAGSVQEFNTGGIVPGGKGTYDDVPARLTRGEVVINSGIQDYPQLLPVLGTLNQMVGGVNFAPGFRPATGDGGLAARAVAGGSLIDYQQLAAAMSEVNLNVGVTTISAAAQRYERPRSLTSN